MKPIQMKTFEVGLVVLVHAQSVEDAQLTLQACIPADLRVERKEVAWCEESVGCYTLN